MKVVLGLLMVAATSMARPEVGIEKKFKSSREINAQQLAPFLDSSQLPLEGRGNSDVKTLAYYGGALGQYLVVHPTGQMYITGQRRVPTGIRDEDEDDVGLAEESGPSDSVAVNQPPENASVAEAKPVGVSIAGEGGVASSQPIAQAIVGPGGLALTRPIATAIAGVPGSENLVIGPGKIPAVRNYAYSVFQPHAYVLYPAATYPAIAY